MKYEVVREQLAGLENRNRDRLAKRRLIQAEHFERKRQGLARKYDMTGKSLAYSRPLAQSEGRPHPPEFRPRRAYLHPPVKVSEWRQL